jgi:hypothetical protein
MPVDWRDHPAVGADGLDAIIISALESEESWKRGSIVVY